MKSGLRNHSHDHFFNGSPAHFSTATENIQEMLFEMFDTLLSMNETLLADIADSYFLTEQNDGCSTKYPGRLLSWFYV
jgi:hypothetical protein